MSTDAFDTDEVARARRYHRPLYALLVVDAAVGLLVLVALTRLDLPLPWWAEVVAGPAVVATSLWAAALVTGWLRYRHELRWGFSTQTPGQWAGDRLRGLAVSVVLTVLAVGGLLALAHLFPHGWVWAAAAAGAALALVLSFLAPLVLEPVFNRFRPLEGPLAESLLALSRRARVPVREVLVADASRRTRKVNAYVSGIGRTRRVVVWDTLLDSPQDELAVVVAHELGHRRLRHVPQGTALAVAGAVAFVALLRALVPEPEPDDAALVLLVATLFEAVTLPLANALSRRWERQADRFSLEVAGDPGAFVRVHRRLALANLADLDPPRLVRLWLGSHPTPPERIASAR
jgi:STE24 endopeptidase